MIWSISVILKPFKTLAIVYYQVQKFAGFASRFLNLIITPARFLKQYLSYCDRIDLLSNSENREHLKITGMLILFTGQSQ